MLATGGFDPNWVLVGIGVATAGFGTYKWVVKTIEHRVRRADSEEETLDRLKKLGIDFEAHVRQDDHNFHIIRKRLGISDGDE